MKLNLDQPPVFHGRITDAEDVFSMFGVVPSDQEGVRILYAWYDTDGVDGEARVVFVRDGKLYAVFAGHDSRFGLEDQWEPQPLDEMEALQYLPPEMTGAADA